MPFVPTRRTIALELAGDLQTGNFNADESDLYYIENTTALDWARASDQTQTLDQRFVEAIGEISDTDGKRLAAIVPALLGDITADHLIELRDICRTALIDHARREIQLYMRRHEVFMDASTSTAEEFT